MRVGDDYGISSKSKTNLCCCNNQCECPCYAHSVHVDHDRKIFMLSKFDKISCFEIAHSHVAKGLFHVLQHGNQNDLACQNQSYSVCQSHPLYQ